MLNRIVIKQKVPLKCKYLDKNIKEHMLKVLKLLMNGNCVFSYGYIIDVKNIINLGENVISSANSLPIFNVTYEADTLKLIVGDIVSGNVCMVLQNGDGIMVNIFTMQVLIPASNMKPFSYTLDSLSFELNNKGTKKSISNGSKIDLEIVASKYEKKKYSYIGKLILN